MEDPKGCCLWLGETQEGLRGACSSCCMAAFCSFSSARVGSRVASEGWRAPVHSSSRQRCRMGISLSKVRHSSSRSSLEHMGAQQPEPVPQDQVSAKPSTQPQPPASPGSSWPSFLSPPCPLLPSTAFQPLPSLFLGRMCLFLCTSQHPL